jgi:flavin reductase (DIM6/NTAB) family NADH-FMN oxidoreductase RutF
VIDQTTKRSLGQLAKGVQVVAATHGGVTRAYTSHWVTQVSFAEPIVMASVSPKHDTYPLMVASGAFTVSILAGDQVEAGQYFSYPGRKFHHLASELLVSNEAGYPTVPGCIAWFHAQIFQQMTMEDHELQFARVVATGTGRLREPALVYSSRQGWRIADTKARKPGESIRDRLLERLAAAGFDLPTTEDDEE